MTHRHRRRRPDRDPRRALAEGEQVVAKAGAFLRDGDAVVAPGRRGRDRDAERSDGLNVSAWAIRKPIPPIVLFLVLALLGIVSFRGLPITRFPNIDVPLVSVTVTQSGAAPAELETQVTKKVEDAVAGVTGVKHVISADHRRLARSRPSSSGSRSNSDRALNDVKDAIARIRADLPRTIDEPIVQRIDIEGLPIVTYAASRARADAGGAVLVRRRRRRARPAGREGRRPGRAHRRRRPRDPRRARSRPAARPSASPRPTSTGSCARPMSTSPAAAARSAGASRRSARWPARARVEELAPTLDRAARRPQGAPRRARHRHRRRRPSRAPSRASTASRSSPSPSRAPRARATRPSAELVAEARRASCRTSGPDVALTLIDSYVTYTVGNYDSAMDTLIEGAVLAVIVVFIFLRDWRATLIAAIALPLSIIPTFWAMDADGLLAQPRQPARHHARHRHPRRRRHRRDREHRPPHAHGQVGLSRRARGGRRDRPRRHRDHADHRRGVRAGELHGRHRRPVLQAVRPDGRGRGAVLAAGRAPDHADDGGLLLCAPKPHREHERDGFVMRGYTRLVALVGAPPLPHAWSLGLGSSPARSTRTRLLPSGFLPAEDTARIAVRGRAAAGLAPRRHAGRDGRASPPSCATRPEVRSVFVDGGRMPQGEQRGAQGDARRQLRATRPSASSTRRQLEREILRRARRRSPTSAPGC